MPRLTALLAQSRTLVIGSVATAVMAVEKGARIVRVHDVGEIVNARRMSRAISWESLEDKE